MQLQQWNIARSKSRHSPQLLFLPVYLREEDQWLEMIGDSLQSMGPTVKKVFYSPAQWCLGAIDNQRVVVTHIPI
jgi:hypothetical protein